MPSLLGENPNIVPRPETTYTVTPQDVRDFGKGLLSAPFTAAPDVLGLLGQASAFSRGFGWPEEQIISGDPIREVIGLNPESTAGMLGEFFDPTSGAMKAAKVAAPALGALAGYMKVATSANANPSLLSRLVENMRGGPAYHGTPHRFDVPSNEHMGTGEGAQAYGWGHYVAESEGTGRYYRDQLARPAIEVDGQIIRATDMEPGQALAYSAASDGDAALTAHIKSRAARGHNTDFAESLKGKAVKRNDQGHIYEYDIPDEQIDKMLDWDAPLSEQPESVRNAIKQAYGDVQVADTGNGYAITVVNSDGVGSVDYSTLAATKKDALLNHERNLNLMRAENAYRHLAQLKGGDEAASRALLEAGIPGIRYFDGASRGKTRTQLTYKGEPYGDPLDLHPSQIDDYVAEQKAKGFGVELDEGTRNMVLFDPENTVRTVKRDGETVYDATRNGLLQQPGSDEEFAALVASRDPNVARAAQDIESGLPPREADPSLVDRRTAFEREDIVTDEQVQAMMDAPVGIDAALAKDVPEVGMRIDVLRQTREAFNSGGADKVRAMVDEGLLPASVLGYFKD